MSDKKKLTLADFPDEPHLNSTDLEYRQAILDAQEAGKVPDQEPQAPEKPEEVPAIPETDTPPSNG